MSSLTERVKNSLRGKNPLLDVDRGIVKAIIESITETVEDFIIELVDERLAKREEDDINNF